MDQFLKIVPIIISLVALVVSILSFLLSHRKAKAEEDGTISKKAADARRTSPQFEFSNESGLIYDKEAGSLLGNDGRADMWGDLSPKIELILEHVEPDHKYAKILLLRNVRPENDPREVHVEVTLRPKGFEVSERLKAASVLGMGQTATSGKFWILCFRARAQDFADESRADLLFKFENADGVQMEQRYSYKVGTSEFRKLGR